METEHQQLQKTPSTIYVVEEMKPEYVEYIDSCKIRAQTDSAYWQTLKDSMSHGMIQLDVDDKSIADDNSYDNSYDNSSVDDVSTDGVSVESMRSLLEYQIKMLENMNYAIDLLTEKCDELTKYCAKLASRLKKYGVDNLSAIDINGITNNSNNDNTNTTIPVPVKETSISLKHRVHTDDDSVNDADSLEESSHDVETVEV